MYVCHGLLLKAATNNPESVLWKKLKHLEIFKRNITVIPT